MAGPDMHPPAAHAHPLVKVLYKLCVREMISKNELSRRSGISETALREWWNGVGTIGLQNIEAALGVFGYGVKQTYIRPPMAADFKVGYPTRTRCGEYATIEKVDNGVIVGRTRLLAGLEWNLAGTRLPAGGDDPLDLIVPQQQQGIA